MSLFHDSNKNIKPHYLGETPPSPKMPRRSPASFYSHRDFASWPDKVFLCFVRDKLIWQHGMDEDDPMIEKLLDVIHRSNSDENSSSL